MTRFITITLVAVAAIAAGLAFGSPATALGMHTNSPAATVHCFGTTFLRTGSPFDTTTFLRTASPSLARHSMMIVTLGSGPVGAGAGFGFAIERDRPVFENGT